MTLRLRGCGFPFLVAEAPLGWRRDGGYAIEAGWEAVALSSAA